MSDIPEESTGGTSTDTYRAAAALHAAAIELSRCRTRFTQPADSHATFQHATALHQALIRAHHAGAQVRWHNQDPDTG